MGFKQQFFEEYSFVFGDKDSPKITPGNILTILRLGLKNYYETYSAGSEHGPINYTYTIIYGNDVNDKSKTFVNPGVGCSHEFLARYYSAISYTQLFFELYIVEFLDKISPTITRQGLKKDHNILTEILKEKDKEKIAKKRTISYSKILSRLKLLFENERSIPEKFRIPEKYHFLKEHQETLTILQEWRNKIMHSGKQVLYYYAFDVLFINPTNQCS